MDSGTSPGGSQIKGTRSGDGKADPRATLQHPTDWREESGYSIQDTTCYMAKFQEGCRTHRIQDAD